MPTVTFLLFCSQSTVVLCRFHASVLILRLFILLTVVDGEDVATAFLPQEFNSEVHHRVVVVLSGVHHKLALGKSATQTGTWQVCNTHWHLASLQHKLAFDKSATQTGTWQACNTNWHLASLQHKLALGKTATQTDTWQVCNINWHLASLKHKTDSWEVCSTN